METTDGTPNEVSTDPQAPAGEAGNEAQDAPTPNAEPAGAGKEDTQGTDAPEVGKGDKDGTDADPRITRANQEAANYRTKLRAEEKARKESETKLEQILKGLSSLSGNGEEQQTPEQMLEAAEKRAVENESRYKQLLATSTLNNVLGKVGADVELARAVVSHDERFKALDPEADDYSSQVGDIVTEVVTQYPKLKAATAAPSSGTPSTKTGNAANDITLKDLEDMSTEDVYALQQAGKLSHLF